MRAIPRFTLGLALASLAACVQPGTQLPTVTYQGASLVQAPSQEMMEAYYCPQVVPNWAVSTCSFFFPGSFAASDMAVAFDLSFKVQNPNHFPIPVAEMLTAVTLFPGEPSSQALGTSCVVFCSPDQPGCTGQPGPDSCTSKAGDIKSIGDFADATAGLLLSSGASLAQGEAPSFVMPEVVQDGEAVIAARLAFGPDPMLDALKHLASQSVSQLETGSDVTFTIPYQIEGTVWLDAGSLGRIAVGFGPATGNWTIPTAQLVPSL